MMQPLIWKTKWDEISVLSRINFGKLCVSMSLGLKEQVLLLLSSTQHTSYIYWQLWGTTVEPPSRWRRYPHVGAGWCCIFPGLTVDSRPHGRISIALTWFLRSLNPEGRGCEESRKWNRDSPVVSELIVTGYIHWIFDWKKNSWSTQRLQKPSMNDLFESIPYSQYGPVDM